MTTNYHYYQQQLLSTLIRWTNTILIFGIVLNSVWIVGDMRGMLFRDAFMLLVAVIGWWCLKLTRQGYFRRATRIYLASGLLLLSLIGLSLGQPSIIHMVLGFALFIVIATYLEPPRCAMFWSILSVALHLTTLTIRCILPLHDFRFTSPELVIIYLFPACVLPILALVGSKAATYLHRAYKDDEDRKQAERALRDNQQRLSATLKSIGEAVITTDNEGHITFMNPAAEHLTGWTDRTGIGQHFAFEVPEQYADETDNLLADSSEEQEIVICMTNDPYLLTRTGKEIPVEYNGTPIKDEAGNITGMVLVMRDITERKQAEKALKESNEHLLAVNKELKTTQTQLIQSAKLASIGELATGVAHELNQPLMYVRNSAQLLMMRPSDDLTAENVHKTLKRVEEGTDRMIRIIAQLRNFARPTDVKLKPVHVHDILANSMMLINEQLKLRGIHMDTQLAPELPRILGNSQQLEQVFINLLSNARDALEGRENPALTIQTAFQPQSNGSGQITICFADNGTGIPTEHLEKLFDPFFTTKEEGRGTGLGLSISYGIIQHHRGHIQVSSIEGEGAIFTLTFPALPHTTTE